MADILTIQKIKIGEDVYPIEVEKFGGKSSGDYQLKENMTTTLVDDSTKYPSAKLLYDTVGYIENLLQQI